MTLMQALAEVKRLGVPVFRTADISAALGLQATHASKVLSRLAAYGHVVRLKRGLWALVEGLAPLALVPHVTAPLPAYVSLQTALYHRGLVSQIPAVVYAVSPARTRTYDTPVAMALPEKALVDYLYLSPARSRLFCALPETDLSEGFDGEAALAMVECIPSSARRAMVRDRLQQLLRAQGPPTA